MSTLNYKNSGFTMVELSIVIVIIGLIIGGVTAGSSLIHQAKLRSVITDSKQYTAAYNTFRLKYEKFPGDMNNATAYFGATVTTNGNGDRIIEYCCQNFGVVAGDPAGATISWESTRAWQHLFLSGILPTPHTGVSLPVNWPESNYTSEGYWAFNANGLLDSTGSYYTHNYLYVGGGLDGMGRIGSSILPVDAYAIDSKLDDGIPRRGHVLSRDGGCGATYDLTSVVPCSFGFILGPPAR